MKESPQLAGSPGSPDTPGGSAASEAAAAIAVSPGRMILRGLVKRCARCGSGHLFRRWFQMVPDCPRCGYHFEREEGFFLGAFVINFAVVLGALMVYIAVAFALTLPDPPTMTLALLGLVVSVGVPLFCYPFSKTVWTAVDLVMRKSFGESYTDIRQPGFRGRPTSDIDPANTGPSGTGIDDARQNDAGPGDADG